MRKNIDLLNEVLRLEYSMIVHIPRLASFVEDEETRRLVLKLGSDSIPHADVVANIIREFGGTPDWSLEPFPRETDLVEIFQVQLEKEKLACQLYRQASDAVRVGSLRDKLGHQAREEESHIRIVEDILSRLSQAPRK